MVWRAAALLVLGAVITSAWTVPGQAATGGTSLNRGVAVVVVPSLDLERFAERGAIGLFVPGAGATVSRERALASLVRGRVISSLVGLDGEVTLRLSTKPAATTIYLELPPAGSHHNVIRYPIAIVGPGYRGILVSGSTRIDGLVSLADVAPTASALANGTRPRISARADTNAVATLALLDARLARAHDARTGATLVLVAWTVLFASLGVLARSALAGRASLLVALVALVLALLLRGVGIDDPAIVVAVLACLTGAFSLVLALRPAVMMPAIVCLLTVVLITLVAWPEINALSAIGPHPDGGGRFYGVTNQVETLLLAPSLAAAALAGITGVVAIGVLLIVTVGWSRAGADGGGLLVVSASFAILLVGLTRARLTPARLVVGAAAIVVLSLAVVGLDALIGGSSHVTDAVGGGPGSVLDDISRRLRISWEGATGAVHTALLCVLSLAGLAWLGIRGRKRPTVVAMLVAIGVSLLVNDTPVDVLGYGALGCLALTAWDESRGPAKARSVAAVHPRAPQEHPSH